MNIAVNIQRVDNSLPLPQYETEGAIAFDIYARMETLVEPSAIVLVPTNLIIEVPEGYGLIIAPRSSTPRKTGLMHPHSIGVIDQDYHGPEDELMVQVYNFTKTTVTIKRGDRIGQGMIIPIARAQWQETNFSNKESRGGFGTTGTNVEEG